MKYIYEVYIDQTFDYIQTELKMFKKPKITTKQCTSIGRERLILAEDESTAIQKYIDRYETNLHELADIFDWYQYRHGTLDNFINTVKAKRVMRTFDYLKENMRADEFLEYCKQELYPIEVVMK